jgi:predicted aminopeptidase
MTDHLNKPLVVIGVLFCALALSGCETLRYYGQAAQGQYSILNKRQPISEIIADPESPEFLRERLAFILAVRRFAETELHLPVKNNYLTYVDLQRPYVVWNVFATPEFSLVPDTWCYPLVGCAAYRGYFSEKNAQEYAEELTKQGQDVYVGGVTAYSTLGWFDDPVLSTFIQYSKASSAALIFHELAHQILYVRDDTVFNESFATTVEQEGLHRWQLTSEASHLYNDYLLQYRHRQEFIQLIMKYRKVLELLYQTDASAPDKRQKKASIFSELREEFNRRKADGTDWAAYDHWMYQQLNNAKISTVVAYHNFVPAFQKILAEKEGDLSQFYIACRELAQKQKDERDRILNTYLEN